VSYTWNIANISPEALFSLTGWPSGQGENVSEEYSSFSTRQNSNQSLKKKKRKKKRKK